jgi:hypothetical protein
MDLKTLEQALRACWDLDTCYPPMRADYARYASSYGQCYGSAKIVNDYFDGKVFVAIFPEGGGHFWNFIKGEEVDMTRDQFEEDQAFPEPEMFSRAEIDARYPDNDGIYALLKQRVDKYLAEHS